jgi:hypothetical protein
MKRFPGNIDDFERQVMGGGCPVFTNDQRSAAAYLEERGKRFLCEWVYGNCESEAMALGWIRPSRIRPHFRHCRVTVSA